jgi:hypothetical protein
MTWNSHVPSHNPGAFPMALVERMTPPSQKIRAIVQWPTTTTRMLTARRKST